MYEKKYNKRAKIREENEKCGWINRKKMLLYLLNSELSWLIQECLGILVARCASCNCMTYFYCAPLQSCRRLYQLRGLTPTTDINLYFTIYRGGGHLPADILNEEAVHVR